MIQIWSGRAFSRGCSSGSCCSYWDERTETPEGEQARLAVERFLNGVVQVSDTPIEAEELAAFNARRQVERELRLRPSP